MRKRKWDSYSSGEELFGLPITHYPELERTQEEIVMLDKLYRWATWGGWVVGEAVSACLPSRCMPATFIPPVSCPCLPSLTHPACLPCLFLPCPLDSLPFSTLCPPCSLYVSVITTIRGYGDFLWVDVVEKIDAMATQVRRWLPVGVVGLGGAVAGMAAG